jgi:hypothetical protein
MNSFLDCPIWSVNYLQIDNYGFTFPKRVYYYNSNTEEFNSPIPPGFVQIPEFEIKNINLLDTIDFELIDKYAIPILRRNEKNEWSIDLLNYENFIIQFPSCTQFIRK